MEELRRLKMQATGARAAYQRVIKHGWGQPTAYVAALLLFSSVSAAVGRPELVSVYAKAQPGRGKGEPV